LRAVYFFLRPSRGPEDAGYQHRSLALAEGLSELGIPVFANINYWRADPHSSETIFRCDVGVSPEDCEIVVAEHVYFDEERRLPQCFLDPGRKFRTVLIDASDGWRTPALASYLRGADLILKCHYSARFDYGPHVSPWAFGLSRRIIDAVTNRATTELRSMTIVSNYRVTHPVRKYANDHFLPRLSELFEIDENDDSKLPDSTYDRLMWEQSGRRHNPAYYGRLLRSSACSAFGGYFVPAFSRFLDSLPLRAAFKLIGKLSLTTYSIAQFDSWRFWESLVAGCLTFHVDLSRYGCVLPVMPENGKHYFGIDLAKCKEEADRVLESRTLFPAIAAHGQRWAMEHYSPVATARRFLNCVQ